MSPYPWVDAIALTRWLLLPAPASELAVQLPAPASSLAVPPPAASTAEAVGLSAGGSGANKMPVFAGIIDVSGTTSEMSAMLSTRRPGLGVA